MSGSKPVLVLNRAQQTASHPPSAGTTRRATEPMGLIADAINHTSPSAAGGGIVGSVPKSVTSPGFHSAHCPSCLTALTYMSLGNMKIVHWYLQTKIPLARPKERLAQV